MSRLNHFINTLKERKKLLRCIFGTLIFQLFITVIVLFYLLNNSDLLTKINESFSNFFLLLIIFTISLLLIYFISTNNFSFSIKFLLFSILGLFQGLFLSLVGQYIPINIIKSVIVSTLIIFIFFLLVGLIIVYLNIDLSWLGSYLILLLLGLILYQIIILFIPFQDRLKSIGITLILMLFSVFIIYDTNIILMKSKIGNRDCISSALDYYLDILNIFSALLNNE